MSDALIKARRAAARVESFAAMQRAEHQGQFAKLNNMNNVVFTEQELSLPQPPPYLRGKLLGLWHREKGKMRSKAKKEGKDESWLLKKGKKMMLTLPLELPEGKENQIRKILTRISTETPPSVANIRCGSSSTMESARAKYQHIGESAFKDNFLKLICGSISDKINMGIQICKLQNDHALNQKYRFMEECKRNDYRVRNMLQFRRRLPACNKRYEIINAIRHNNVILVSGETGCGKTTQVPQFILEEEIMNNRGSTCHIVCTQPRRISAISMADRVADERGERCGESVGYQIRLEKLPPRSSGSILFCTTGVLLQIMNSDPFLTNVSHVILDEIHERDTISDFVIAVLKDIVPSRPDLKVILMSATLNADQFSRYFNNCPTVHIPGFTFPVREFYLEDVYNMLRYPVMNLSRANLIRERKKMSPEELRKERAVDTYIDHLERNRMYPPNVISNLRCTVSTELNIPLIRDLIKYISYNQGPGGILVFLPGWDKISALNKSMNESHCFPPNRFVIIPVHSMMPTASQKEIFRRPPPGVRKIVLATNIAETSITIDDIVYVIDTGKIKIKMFELDHNISTLREHWVSQANSRQRRGRAGRVQEGVCFHLYPKGREQVLDPYQQPEMMRIRLEEVILQAKVLQVGKIGPFLQKVIDPPDPRAVEISLELLTAMNAVDEDEQLTPLGYHLAQLPVDPQAGKMMLLAAMFGCLDPIASIASSISFKDPFVCPLGQERNLDKIKKDLDFGRRSDHLLIAHIITQWEIALKRGKSREFAKQFFISSNIIELLREMKQQFAQHLYQMNFLVDSNVKNEHANVNSNNLGLIKAIICSGLYPNVAIVKTKVKKRQDRRSTVTMYTMEDGKIALHPKSVNSGVTKFESSFLVYYMKLKSTGIFLHDCTLIYPLALIFFCHNLTLEDNDNHKKTIVVNKHIKFRCKESTAYLIQELRAWLDWLLEYKVSHPGVTNWNSTSDECLILSAIIELISTEHKMYYSYDEEDGENEDEEDDGDDDDDDSDLSESEN